MASPSRSGGPLPRRWVATRWRPRDDGVPIRRIRHEGTEHHRHGLGPRSRAPGSRDRRRAANVGLTPATLTPIFEGGRCPSARQGSIGLVDCGRTFPDPAGWSAETEQAIARSACRSSGAPICETGWAARRFVTVSVPTSTKTASASPSPQSTVSATEAEELVDEDDVVAVATDDGVLVDHEGERRTGCRRRTAAVDLHTNRRDRCRVAADDVVAAQPLDPVNAPGLPRFGLSFAVLRQVFAFGLRRRRSSSAASLPAIPVSNSAASASRSSN